MKRTGNFVVGSVVAGLLVLVPVYLAILLLLKAAASLGKFVAPLAKLLPEWLPADRFLSILLVLVVAFLVGAASRTRTGRVTRRRVETSVLERIPGYELFRSLTNQLAGAGQGDHLEAGDGGNRGRSGSRVHHRGARRRALHRLCALDPDPICRGRLCSHCKRVHPVDVPFTQAIKPVSRWGSGCEELVAAMRTAETPVGKLRGPSALGERVPL